MIDIELTNRLKNIVKSWQELYPNGKIILFDENSIDELLIAVYSNNTIYLLGESFPTILYAPKIVFSMITPAHLHIEDILMKHNNVGNGTIAMNALLLFAQQNNIQLITGNLSTVDEDHKARRDHFYKKFGFDVTDTYIRKSLIPTKKAN